MQRSLIRQFCRSSGLLAAAEKGNGETQKGFWDEDAKSQSGAQQQTEKEKILDGEPMYKKGFWEQARTPQQTAQLNASMMRTWGMNMKTEGTTKGGGRASQIDEHQAPGLKDSKTASAGEKKETGSMFQARPYLTKQRAGIITSFFYMRVYIAFFLCWFCIPFIGGISYNRWRLNWEWVEAQKQGLQNFWHRKSERVFVQYLTQRENPWYEVLGFKSYDISGKDDSTLDNIQPYYQDHQGKAGMPLPDHIPNLPPAPGTGNARLRKI